MLKFKKHFDLCVSTTETKITIYDYTKNKTINDIKIEYNILMLTEKIKPRSIKYIRLVSRFNKTYTYKFSTICRCLTPKLIISID